VNRALSIVALAAIVVGVVAALATGAELLLWELPGGMALGNPLAAFGNVALAGIGYLLAGGRVTRRLGLTAIVLAVSWYPVSIAMAGNANLNFSGGLFGYWLYWTGAVIAVASLSALASLSGKLLQRLRRTRPAVLSAPSPPDQA
jgi:hypothetical protein